MCYMFFGTGKKEPRQYDKNPCARVEFLAAGAQLRQPNPQGRRGAWVACLGQVALKREGHFNGSTDIEHRASKSSKVARR